jgi:hypothetical protein
VQSFLILLTMYGMEMDNMRVLGLLRLVHYVQYMLIQCNYSFVSNNVLLRNKIISYKVQTYMDKSCEFTPISLTLRYTLNHKCLVIWNDDV